MRLAAALLMAGLGLVGAGVVVCVDKAAAADAVSLQVSGLVKHALALSVADLHALPPHTVEAEFTTMHGEDHHLWTGVLLWDVVQTAGLMDEPGHRTTMRHVMMARGEGRLCSGRSPSAKSIRRSATDRCSSPTARRAPQEICRNCVSSCPATNMALATSHDLTAIDVR